MPQGMLPGPLRMQPGTPAWQAQMQPEMLPKLLQMQPGTPKFTQFARESSKVRPKDAREAGKVEVFRNQHGRPTGRKRLASLRGVSAMSRKPLSVAGLAAFFRNLSHSPKHRLLLAGVCRRAAFFQEHS
jgi:hypothetical protein